MAGLEMTSNGLAKLTRCTSLDQGLAHLDAEPDAIVLDRFVVVADGLEGLEDALWHTGLAELRHPLERCVVLERKQQQGTQGRKARRAEGNQPSARVRGEQKATEGGNTTVPVLRLLARKHPKSLDNAKADDKIRRASLAEEGLPQRATVTVTQANSQTDARVHRYT